MVNSEYTKKEASILHDQMILNTNELTKKYGNVTAVSQVNLHVKKGRIYGLLGRNGAGKTTIMKMILGLASISSGDISIFNKPLRGNEKSIYQRIGSIIETPSFYSYLTGTQNLEIFARLRGTINKHAVENALSVVGLPYRDQKIFSSYSLGMKQRLGIANAILNDPELLLLDEPTNGLDPVGIVEIRSFLKKLCAELGKTILISSHILSEIALLADDIGIIHEGRLMDESSMQALQEKNKKYIEVAVDSVPNAAQLIEQKLQCSDYAVMDKGCIRIFDTGLDTAAVAACLVTNGIAVSALSFQHETLEDYFTKLTGGETYESCISNRAL